MNDSAWSYAPINTSKSASMDTSHLHVSRTTRIRRDEPLAKDLPSWLPPLPPPHTYLRTPVTSIHKQSYPELRRRKAEQKRQEEMSLIRLKLTSSDKICLNPKKLDKVVKYAEKKVEKQNQLGATDPLKQTKVRTVETIVQKHLPSQLFVLKPLPTTDPLREALLECCADKKYSFNDTNKT